MSDFDPYYKWLGIPAEEQPPNHYRLLGIQLLEQSTDVIEAAANRQMAYLQELSAGDDHVDEAQGLLGEVARARVCLLAAESKARYDAELTSTLDSLPEAEEATPENVAVPEFDLADRGAAAPRRPAARRSGGKKRTSTARRSGRRSSPTKNASRSAARKEDRAATPSGASSLQVKLAAAVIPAVVVVLVGIVWMVAGGDSSSKQGEKNNKENKTGSGASLDQGNEKDPLAAATTKFGNQAEQTASNRPPKPVVKPPKADSQPVNSKLDKPSQPLAPAPTEEPDDEPSELEQAEALLNSKGLERIGFDKWHLAKLDNEIEGIQKAIKQSQQQGQVSPANIEQLVDEKMNAWRPKIWNEFMNALNRWNTPPHEENDHKEMLQKLRYIRGGEETFRGQLVFRVGNTMHPLATFHDLSIDPIPIERQREQFRQEIMGSSTGSDSPSLELVNEKQNLERKRVAKYAELAKRKEIQDALKTVEGKLAEAPAMLESPGDGDSQPVSIDRGDANEKPETPDSDQDAPNSENNPTADGDQDKQQDEKKEAAQPAASYAELKDQLTALENETRLALGKFNKGAKEYIKQKKDLVKKIKAVEGIIAQRSKYQDSLPDGEQKIKFGQETEEKYIKPLAKGKSQLQGLSQPDTGPIEGNLKRAEKLLKQIEGTPEYHEKPGSIDSLAAKIAKYRKGLNVQQARMAK